MTHYNPVKGFGEPEVPPSQDLDDYDPTVYQGNNSYGNFKGLGKLKLQFYGNEKTMNLNPLILANIQGSPYFKNELFEMRTFHEVVDEIYYKVDHLEPWAAGSRKTAGRSSTGMCGGVRGVSAGGVTSSAFCLLYKLYTLKLTKKQVLCLINHCDSPYIRGLGFMYLRFTLPPAMMFDWFEPYLDDQEEIDVKAGGGKPMMMGEMIKLMITRLEWFETRFPRIAVNHEKMIREKLDERAASARLNPKPTTNIVKDTSAGSNNQAEGRKERNASESRSRSRSRSKRRSRSRDERRRSRSRSRERSKKSHKRDRSRDRSRGRYSRDRSRDRHSRDRSRDRDRHSRDRSRDRHRERKDDKHRDKHRGRDYADELRKYKEDSSSRHHKKKSRRSRSRS